MKKLLLIICIAICGCNSVNKSDEMTIAEKDSFTLKTYGRTFDDQVKYSVDSMMDKAKHDALLDTAGLYKSPIVVLSAKPVRVEYSNRRNVYLSYKNIGKKTIVAIKFRWYGVNAFGDPADLGNPLAAGFGGGFTEDVLKPGKSDSGTWDIYSKDVKKIKLAWAYEVAFADETKWTLADK